MRQKRTTTICSDVVRNAGEELERLRSNSIYARLRQHLDTCPNCEAYVDSLKLVVKLYRRYPDPRLTNRVRRRLYKVISLTH